VGEGGGRGRPGGTITLKRQTKSPFLAPGRPPRGSDPGEGPHKRSARPTREGGGREPNVRLEQTRAIQAGASRHLNTLAWDGRGKPKEPGSARGQGEGNIPLGSKGIWAEARERRPDETKGGTDGKCLGRGPQEGGEPDTLSDPAGARTRGSRRGGETLPRPPGERWGPLPLTGKGGPINVPQDPAPVRKARPGRQRTSR
jgi:hypothetical protein